MFSRKILLIPAFLLLAAACNKEENLPKEKIAHIYVDLQIVKERYAGQADSLMAARDSVFNDYGVSEEKYEKSLRDIPLKEEEWRELFEYSQEYIDTLKTKY